jgi:hypothetical protein
MIELKFELDSSKYSVKEFEEFIVWVKVNLKKLGLDDVQYVDLRPGKLFQDQVCIKKDFPFVIVQVKTAGDLYQENVLDKIIDTSKSGTKIKASSLEAKTDYKIEPEVFVKPGGDPLPSTAPINPKWHRDAKEYRSPRKNGQEKIHPFTPGNLLTFDEPIILKKRQIKGNSFYFTPEVAKKYGLKIRRLFVLKNAAGKKIHSTFIRESWKLSISGQVRMELFKENDYCYVA